MNARMSSLPNGMRVVTHSMPHLETASLGVWINAGARFEQADQHGISHLLEHMAFKGTARRTARQIAEEIESVGGELNAATSYETTSYYARVLKADIPLAVDIIADILRDPVFDGAELAREQDVIIQEIAAAEDSPDDVAHDLAQSLAFPNQPAGRAILGTPESVRAFTPDQLADYMKLYYVPGAMVLAAAGAVEHEGIVDLANKVFGDMPPAGPFKPDPAIYAGGWGRSARSFEQSHLVIAYEGPSYLSDDMYTGQIFSSLFGGGMSSRLFQEAREARGLCYSIYSYCWGLADSGLFGIHAATGPAQANELASLIFEQMHRAAGDYVSDDELARAKAQLKSGLLMSLESSGSRAEQVARQTLAFGEPRSVEELVSKVDAVDKQAVRSFVERTIISSNPCFSVVGPVDDEGALEALVRGQAHPPVRAAE